MMPAEELTIDLRRLGALSFIFNGGLSQRLLEVIKEVQELEDGACYRFFDPQEFVCFDRMRAILKEKPTRLREAGYTIWKLAGKQVKVRRDPSGNTLLDYRNHLPEDFFPVVILDAQWPGTR